MSATIRFGDPQPAFPPPADDPLADLRALVTAAEMAAYGDSNDAELDAYREALDAALALIPGGPAVREQARLEAAEAAEL